MKKVGKGWLCVGLALVLSLALCVTAPPGDSQAAPGSNLARVEAYIREFMAMTPIPGLSVVLVQGDQVLFERGYGVETLGSNRRMTAQSSSAIGSFTKSFTTLAIMQLVEQGRIELDAPVVEYLPWFALADKEASQQITVRMLLSHTSGLPRIDNWMHLTDTSSAAMERGVRALSSYGLRNEPGLVYDYSNEGFNIAGVIIEQVSGLSYADYIEENILKPLQMKRSTTKLERLAEIGVLYGHLPGVDRGIPLGPSYFNATALAAGMELRASAADLGHYLIAMLNGGVFRGVRIASAESITQMWRPHVGFAGTPPELGGNGLEEHYGLGWMISEIDGRLIIHHGGNTLSMSSMNMIDLENGLAVSVLANIGHLDRYAYPGLLTLANNLLHIASGNEPTDFGIPKRSDPSLNDFELPTELVPAFVGEYVSSEGGARIMVEEHQGRLVAKVQRSQGISEHLLDFSSPNRFVLRNIGGTHQGSARISPNGQVLGLQIGGLGLLARVQQAPPGKYAEVSSSQLSFLLPAYWQASWHGQQFAAQPEGASGKVTLLGGVRNGAQCDLAELLQEQLAGHTMLRTGQEQIESLGGHFFREMSVISEADGEKLQHILIHTSFGGRSFYALLSAPYGESTPLARDVLLPLMRSLTWR